MYVSFSQQQKWVLQSPYVCINLFEFVDCQGHLLIFDNFCILAFNARVAQLLNKIIGVDADAGEFVKQRGYRNKKSIAGGAWL